VPLTADSLVSTKLRPPEARPKLVARPRLTEKLEREAGRRLTLVSAPAGFGKSTLLGEWLSQEERPVAWVSLDEGDNDPARFLSYLVAALNTVEEGIGEGALAALRSSEPPRIEALTGALINEMAALPGELAVVLDDYHLIDSESVHRIVAFLLEHLPENTHLIISSRVDPPLPLARLRARDQILEIGASELAFTPEETAAFLRGVMGVDLSTEDVATLEERTEGWIAGLQLAALSMRDRKDISGFVEAFSGSHRDVLDFLAEEVLERQLTNVREFLLKTSILDGLSGALCDALTGRDDGQRTLQHLERENLFVVALDDERRWYRYHHLFADFLRGRLGREGPGHDAGLHRRAAAWYEGNGWVSEAVGHALAAGDDERAARLVEHNAQALVLRGEGATVDRWMAALPAGLVRSRPRLSLARAMWALIAGRADEVEPLLTDAERALATADQPHETPVEEAASGLGNVPGTVAQLRAELARQRGDAESAIRFAQRALTHAGEGDLSLRYLSRWNLADATLMQGRVGEAEEALADLVRDPWATGPRRYLAVRACYALAQAQRGQGRLGAALETCQYAFELATESGLRAAAGVGHVGLAEILREKNELDDALEHATEGVALCRQLGYVQKLVLSLTVLARVRQARGGQAGAVEAIGEAERVLPSPEVVVDPIFSVAVQRARLLLAQGEVSAAARWVAERRLSVEDGPSYLSEPEHLVLARVLLAEGKPEQARMLLERLLAAAEAAGRTDSVIEIVALQALARWAGNRKELAVNTLARALALAEPEGYVRTFVDEGPPMVALLSEVLNARQRGSLDPPVPAHYLRKLLAATERDATGAAPPTVGLSEPLTGREREVLVLIAAGKSNRRIAQELFVGLGTVKTHLRNLYRKLDVQSRTQAVARARELNLL
jgi:LuxR family transcriptional regulator, maltose regulon positive regulatory protein